MTQPHPCRDALALALFSALALGACDDAPDGADGGAADAMQADSSAPDAGPTDAGEAPQPCQTDAECDDGIYCNGAEVCVDDFCEAADVVDCGDGIECTVDECLEDTRECANTPPDADGDGVADAACLGADGLPLGRDCDDDDANRYPDNPEVCDGSHDEDCDPSTFGEQDLDSDGQTDAACCNVDDDGASVCGLDCDDTEYTVYEGGPELCDGLDNDCDVDVDEDSVPVDWGIDCDGDNFGVPTTPAQRNCAVPEIPTGCASGGRWVSDRTDCDDTLAVRNPGNPEVCDGLDNNCDAAMLADEGLTFLDYYPDCDGDTHGDETASPINACSTPAAPSCAGGTWVVSSDDCDDTRAVVYTGFSESCDGLDNDCDTHTDEDVPYFDYYPDCDGDGDGDENATARSECMQPGEAPSACTTGVYVQNDDDCDDSDAAIGTDATEVCDYVDNDCDGTVDLEPDGNTMRLEGRYDGDSDGVGNANAVECRNSPNFQNNRNGDVDCDDADPDVFPGQTEYFEEPTSYECPDATYTNVCEGSGRGQCGRTRQWCIMPGVCVPVDTCYDTPTDTIDAVGVWNYDCNDTHDRPDFGTCTCNPAPMQPVCQGGYQSGSGQDCGAMVEHRTCESSPLCVSSPGFSHCDIAASEMRVLPCR